MEPVLLRECECDCLHNYCTNPHCKCIILHKEVAKKCNCDGFHFQCENTSYDCSLHSNDQQVKNGTKVEKKTKQEDLCFNCKLDYRYFNSLENLLKEKYNEQYLFQISMTIERLRKCNCH